MYGRGASVGCLLLQVVLWRAAVAQPTPGTLPDANGSSLPAAAGGEVWRASDGSPPQATSGASLSDASLDALRVRPAEAAVPLRGGSSDFPRADEGQVWQQYDISVYTSRVTGSEHPEQAVIDWILRETGSDIWFRPPLGLLSATPTTVSVYHTPAMQQVVAEVIGRFVNGTQDPHVLGLRVVAVDSPNWRSAFLHRLRPVSVQSAGIEAWLVSKEDAALLVAELRRRVDFREHSAPQLVFHNGQTQSISNLRPRIYVKGLRTRPQEGGWVGYDVERGQIQEGFTLQVSPLLSQDERTIDAVLKCNIDQVERLVPVTVDVPGFGGQAQRIEIQVPQVASWRLHERFRWPANQVLLMSCGVVASPGPERQSAWGLPNPFARTGNRADALLLIEVLGKASQALIGPATAAGGTVVPTNARY